MTANLGKRFFFLCVALALVVVSLTLTGRGLADVAAQTGQTKTLDRDLEPVIIQGSRVSALIGAPTNRLYVYTFTGDTRNSTPIPAQVDEVTGDGDYTNSEDGVLDANDEIVFMAGDTGDQPSDTSSLDSWAEIDTSSWYEIEVVDPTSGKKGWAYLVRRNSPASIGSDYVDYNDGTSQITTSPHRYRLGFSATHLGFDYLTLPAGSTQDLLDRTKVRVSYLSLDATEENVPFSNPAEIIDGPVRAIIQQFGFGPGNIATTYLAYGSMVHSLVAVDSGISVSSVRTSIDLNDSASGGTFYNQNVSGGVTIDGSPDTVAQTPFSNWAQVSHANGRLIQVADATPLGGTPKNYYCDDTTSPVECDSTVKTGDGFAYGDAGILVEGGVNRTAVFSSTLYVLPPAGGGESDNVGSTYADYFAKPLFTMVFLKGERHTIFLPVVLKVW
ncbi:MAG: hypothetical protein Kow0063_09710 [Anaerolineae bacterium]